MTDTLPSSLSNSRCLIFAVDLSNRRSLTYATFCINYVRNLIDAILLVGVMFGKYDKEILDDTREVAESLKVDHCIASLGETVNISNVMQWMAKKLENVQEPNIA